MTKQFDERNMAKSRRVCEDMEAAHVTQWRKLTERERQILCMWPRFEDGEPVWYGDEVDTMRSSVIAVEFFDGSITLSSDFDHLHLSFGERVKRPAPKVPDADGVEIKAGDTVWYRSLCTMGSMRKATVAGFDEHSLDGPLVTLKDEAGKTWYIHPKKITHTPPDSWERLEEDAVKEPCDYFGVECDEDKGRSGCPHLHEGRDCAIDLQADLIRRAKALAGVEVGQ